MEKRVQKKEDGRYIIFYTFPQGEDKDKDQKEEWFHVRITLEPAAQAVGDCGQPPPRSNL